MYKYPEKAKILSEKFKENFDYGYFPTSWVITKKNYFQKR